MQKIGIICEYNPFHNGHLYHINQIKNLYPDSLLILVLNGYFLQRGEVSLLTKEDKVNIALENNVDLVLELPVIFGTQSADKFAFAAIEILNYLKVDKIVFGSESNNIETLQEIANKQINNSDYEKLVQKYLKEKVNYPTALAKALNIDFDFNNPNDLLGISYLKAIRQINPNIQAECIQRTSSYHDRKSTSDIISASNIRHKLKNNEDITNYLPSLAKAKLKTINEDLLFKILQYKINTCDNLEIYLDVDEGIENRLKALVNQVDNIEDFIMAIKTKRYTYNKIKRMLMHILLDFKKEDNLNHIEYLRVLGFNKKGQKYLNSLKKNLDISLKPIVSSKTYSLEQKAYFIYDLVTNTKTSKWEKRNKPEIN